jgi:hypothetical protein
VHLLSDVKQKVEQFASENATTLLTAGGVVGTVGTAVLAWRGGYKYAEMVMETSEELMTKDDTQFETVRVEDNLEIRNPVIPTRDKLFMMAPQLVPPVLTGGFTITAIVLSHRMSAQKAAALAAAYGLAERNFGDYKAKVEEKLTGPKTKQINDDLAEDAVNKTPGSDRIVIVEGEVLCLEKPGGRYFNSTMETIRQAVNATNAEVFNHGFALLSFFYTELGLDSTTWSEEVGFNRDHLLELTYSTQLAPGNRPCIVIDFARLPKAEYDYDPKYS